MKSLLLASAAVLAAPTLALADDDQPTTVDSVIVTANPNPEDPPVVADARKRLSETPGAVSVISAESYQSRTALALDDVLRDAPGVYAQRKWGGDIRISIRGSGIGNANHNRGLIIAQDGLPLNEADGYGDSQSIDPLIARFTEVYRGGNALRFGGALLGGAINVVTPSGSDAGFENRLRLEAGSFGLARQHVALARQYGDWDVYVAGTNQTAQGWRSQSQQNLQFGTLNIGRSLGEDREVRLIIGGANVKQEIPGSLTYNQFLADPRQTAAGNLANDQGRDQRVLRTSLRTRWRLNDSAVLEAGAYVAWKDLDHPIFQVIDQESRNYGAFARLDLEGEVSGLRADGFVGVWARAGDLDSNFYVNARGARGAPTTSSLQNADALDAFAEGRVWFTNQLALAAGASLGVARRDYRSVATPTQPPSATYAISRDYDWVAPRIGLIWEAPDGAQVFANLTKSVEPPNFGALSPSNAGFADIAAQKAWTAEIGTRGRRGLFVWDLTFYRAWLEDELLQYSTGPSIPVSTFNADKTIHQGIEAALDWSFAEGWRLRQTWTWSDFRFKDDIQYGDNRLPIVPEHFYRAELRYDHPIGWFVAPSVEWSASDIYVDYTNRFRAPSYATLNLNLGWAVNDKVSVFVDARNLTDEEYVSNVQAQLTWNPATSPGATATLWPGDGRSVSAGLTLTF